MPDPIDDLFSLQQFGIKLGLENIRVLVESMDHPDRAFRSIIVAGTNGKGSVAATLETSLRAAGYRTGRFTSPHLVTLEERFVVEGRPILPESLAAEAGRLRDLIDTLIGDGRLSGPPTFFEATTAIALSLFRQAGIQVAVLEVGMGGRFDATNVVSPIAAAIPSIDLDHQEHLGATLAEIAFEKAGVIKPGMLVVTAETKSEPLAVLRRVCRERGATLVESVHGVETSVTLRDGVTVAEISTDIARYGPVRMGLRGRHQVRNACVALRLLERLGSRGISVTREAIVAGLTDTRWPGRLELVPVGDHRSLVLDAAHNVASVEAFAAYVGEVWPDGLPVVFAAFGDKDVAGMARALGSAASMLVCAPLDSQRALAPDDLARRLAEARPDLRVEVATSLSSALETAWTQGDLIGATGSAFLVGELIDHLALQS